MTHEDETYKIKWEITELKPKTHKTQASFLSICLLTKVRIANITYNL